MSLHAKRKPSLKDKLAAQEKEELKAAKKLEAKKPKGKVGVSKPRRK